MSITNDAPRALRAWLLVALGFCTLALSYSSRSALSMAMPIWERSFEWPRTTLSLAAALAMLMMALVAPLVGSVVDRYGARVVLGGGLASLASGMFIVARLDSPDQVWLLFVGFSLLGGLGFGSIAQHVFATVIAHRFPRRAGLPTGISLSGSSAGQLLVLPLLSLLIAGGVWQAGFWGLGAVALLLIPLTVAILSEGNSKAPGSRPDVPTPASSVRAQLLALARSGTFHALFWSYLICGFTTSGVIETHFLPYANLCGFAPVPSATAFGILSGFNLLGMILAGWLADRMHRPLLLFAIYLARALCFLLLLRIGDNYELLLAFAVLFGLFDYSTVPVTTGLLSAHTGIRSLGLALGLLSAGHALGGAMGAYLGGWFYDRTGLYDSLWWVSILLAVAAALMVVGLRNNAAKATADLMNPETA
ncbi:TPA: MFS transporter [Pseudomonas aeruginosa]|nr:MFS transporter [Pseudomonas aeruginosa]HCI2557516.1 MFS transporter [Pseudomonas aeruginosa]HCI2571649.1 MFS transporter [Pseudomonas aeruginosa]